MTEVNIIFTTDKGLFVGYEVSNTDTTKYNFVKVEVKVGTWILYEHVEYNKASAGGAKIMIVKGGDPPKDLPYSPKSIWRATIADGAATLFEHTNYAGKRKMYIGGSPDITAEFPINNPKGVSSMIIWPGKNWQLFPEKNYQPQPGTLALPNWYHSFTAANSIFPNDKLASLHPH